MAGQLYIRYRGKVQGPFSPDELRVLVRRGQLTRVHEISTDGTQWSRAVEFPELFASTTARPGLELADEPEPDSDTPEAGSSPASDNPPAPVAWYYHQLGTAQGPVDSRQLQLLIAVGQVSPADLVWKEGMPEWLPAEQVPGLVKPTTQPAATAVGLTPVAPSTYQRVSGMAITSLILGILGLLVCFICPLLATIFGGIAIHQIRISEGNLKGTGLAVAGLVLGIVGLVIQIAYVAIVLTAAGTLQ